MIIAIDFDGTVVKHGFPLIGEPVPGAIAWMKRWQAFGARLVLWTMRSDGRADGTTPLAEAIEYCAANGVLFWGVNRNPEQFQWTQSPKVYANVYVDDAAAGCPLISEPGERPWVDWDVIGPQVAALIDAERVK